MNTGLVSRSSTLQNPPNWMMGTVSSSGVAVNRNSSLLLSAVYRCITLISESMASLPVHVYRNDGEIKALDKNHSLYYLLNVKPNSLMDAYQFKQLMNVHLLTNGNAYARIIRNRRGKITSLEALDAQLTEPQMVNGQKVYYTFISDKMLYDTAVVLNDNEVVHLKMFDYGGLKGLSPIQKAMRERLGLGLASQSQQSKVYRDGTFIRGILSTDSVFKSTDQLDRARTRWNELYNSVSGTAGDVATLDGGWKFQRVALTPEEAKFIESNKFTVDDVGRFYGVPSTLLNNLDNASYNNVENLQIEFTTFNLRPLAEKTECQYRASLLTPAEVMQGFEVEHDMDAMLRGDMKSRSEFYRLLFNIGAANPNEIRKKEGLNPYENGNRYYVPLNMIPSEMVESVLLKNTNGNTSSKE